MNLGKDNKTAAIAGLILSFAGRPIRRLLVVGCGSGLEAAILAQSLHADVTGIDVSADFDADAAKHAHLLEGDATCLEFADGEFDCVYSYHALEHIPDYRRALSEMNRVLSSGGCFCIGTPNRLRLVGYLGSKDATLRQKFQWNMADIKARLTGRFRNEYGAHAGYSAPELARELVAAFGDAVDITVPYYLDIYKTHARLVKGIAVSGLGRFAWPSVYFLGRK